MASPNFETEDAHKYFAANCFNRAWELIDKENRTPEEDQQMVLLNQASLWHWTQRDDCTKRNLSIGYWQAARIYALIGDSHNARQAAELSLKNTGEEEPFYLGYAYEAMSRAELVAGNRAAAKKYLGSAQGQLERVTEADEKKWLKADLTQLSAKLQ